MRDFLAGEFIDIIEWLDDTNDTMVWRFSRPRNEIKNGAQLIVRPGQTAVFVEQGEIADVFEPGRHTLTTDNLPVLSTFRGWKYGFESPFKAEIVFASTRQFTGRKWGTANSVIVRDPEIGPARLRAYGTYSIRVADPSQFVRELVGTNSTFLIDEITDQLRDLVVAKVSTGLADGGISVIELAAKYPELGARVRERAAPDFARYGLELSALVIENVSLPPEVEAALDQKSKMSMIGNVDQYAAFQAADALRDAARNPSGGAAAGVGIGMGAAMAQRAMSATDGSRGGSTGSELPPPLPRVDWYYAVGGERRGPVDFATLAALAQSGGISAATLLWKTGMKDWAPAVTIDDMKAPLAAKAEGA